MITEIQNSLSELLQVLGQSYAYVLESISLIEETELAIRFPELSEDTEILRGAATNIGSVALNVEHTLTGVEQDDYHTSH